MNGRVPDTVPRREDYSSSVCISQSLSEFVFELGDMFGRVPMNRNRQRVATMRCGCNRSYCTPNRVLLLLRVFDTQVLPETKERDQRELSERDELPSIRVLVIQPLSGQCIAAT